MCGFHNQNITQDESHGRRGLGSEARGLERQREIPNLPRRTRAGYLLHLHPIDLPGCGTQRGLEWRLDTGPASFHRVRRRDGRCRCVGVESLPSGLLL